MKLAPTLTALAILTMLAATAAFAQQDAAANVYVVIHVDLAPNNSLVDGGKLLQTYAADSRKEPGSVRFELLQDLARKNHFTLVEVWQNHKAFDDHLSAAHSKQFREKLQPLLGSPFDERLHSLMQ
jgi:quinol monooxygenase YgiN